VVNPCPIGLISQKLDKPEFYQRNMFQPSSSLIHRPDSIRPTTQGKALHSNRPNAQMYPTNCAWVYLPRWVSTCFPATYPHLPLHCARPWGQKGPNMNGRRTGIPVVKFHRLRLSQISHWYKTVINELKYGRIQ